MSNNKNRGTTPTLPGPEELDIEGLIRSMREPGDSWKGQLSSPAQGLPEEPVLPEPEDWRSDPGWSPAPQGPNWQTSWDGSPSQPRQEDPAPPQTDWTRENQESYWSPQEPGYYDLPPEEEDYQPPNWLPSDPEEQEPAGARRGFRLPFFRRKKQEASPPPEEPPAPSAPDPLPEDGPEPPAPAGPISEPPVSAHSPEQASAPNNSPFRQSLDQLFSQKDAPAVPSWELPPQRMPVFSISKATSQEETDAAPAEPPQRIPDLTVPEPAPQAETPPAPDEEKPAALDAPAGEASEPTPSLSTPPAPPQPTVGELDQKAFQQGQVITLKLRHRTPAPPSDAPAIPPIYDQAEDLELEQMLSANAGPHRPEPPQEHASQPAAPVPPEPAPEEPVKEDPPATKAPPQAQPAEPTAPEQKSAPQEPSDAGIQPPPETEGDIPAVVPIRSGHRRRDLADVPIEEEDSALEAMLNANSGDPAPQQDTPPQVTLYRPDKEELPPPAEPPAQEDQPEEPTGASEAKPDQPEQSQPEDSPAETSSPDPEEKTAQEDAAQEDTTQEEGEIPDESLLQPPGPTLGQRLARFLLTLAQRRANRRQVLDASFEAQEDAPPLEKPKPSKRPKQEKPEPDTDNVIPLPQEKPNPLKRKWEEMEERANAFADSMFQGDSQETAQEEELHRKAEQHIPGTDEERPRPQRRVKEAPKKPPIRQAPDTSPKQLSRTYYSSWKSCKGRLPLQLVLALALIVLGAIADGAIPGVSVAVFSDQPQLAGLVLTIGLILACLVGLDTLLDGLFQLFRLRPALNTLSSLGTLLTLADGLIYSTLGREGPLPFAGFAALSLWAIAWGNCRKRQGLYLACQMAAATSHPQRLTLDQDKWDNKGTFVKEYGTAKGFGSQIQEPDGAQRVYQYASPVMMLACLVFGILSAVGQGGIQQLIWNWSVIFIMATPLTATLAYAVPYTRLVKRLNRSGVILAGWDGADSMKGEAGIAITDTDLFPDGYVKFNGIKNFGNVSLEKLTGCTASMMREMDTGLVKIFDDLIRTQGGFYRRVDNLKAAEAGGFSGIIRGDEVLVGSADYLTMMGIPLRQGYQVRNAVFCVINGQLQGIFALNYSLSPSVKPALSALIHGGVNPILATRDFNITPTMLRQRFRLPTDRMEYPPVDKRHYLSAQGQKHNSTLAALIFRDGISSCTDAILGGRRLRAVVRLNTVIAVTASVVGALLGFYLTLTSAFYSLNPLNLLFFLAMWLVPSLLISNGVDQF